MLVLFILVVVLAIVQILTFSKFSKINENIDKLFHEALKHEGKLLDCKNRLDAHYSDIVRCEKKIEVNSNDIYAVSSKLSTHIKETQEVVVENGPTEEKLDEV